mmetsp:Transcript_38406/g.113926  ORF Transcript_38406/g.113926 Transcript_38406/m.113926 type:complete len:355 (+) Transcript_38406:235-1299(+)
MGASTAVPDRKGRLPSSSTLTSALPRRWTHEASSCTTTKPCLHLSCASFKTQLLARSCTTSHTRTCTRRLPAQLIHFKKMGWQLARVIISQDMWRTQGSTRFILMISTTRSMPRTTGMHQAVKHLLAKGWKQQAEIMMLRPSSGSSGAKPLRRRRQRLSRKPCNALRLTPPSRSPSASDSLGLPKWQKFQSSLSSRRSTLPSWKRRRQRKQAPQRSRAQPPSGMARRSLTIRAAPGLQVQRTSDQSLTTATCQRSGCIPGAGTPKVSMPSASSQRQHTCYCQPAWTARSRSGTCTAARSACAHTWATRRVYGMPFSQTMAAALSALATTRTSMCGTQRPARSFVLSTLGRCTIV